MIGALIHGVRRAAALGLILLSAPLVARLPPVTAPDMLRHIEILASDRFEGRAPGSAGERLATDYIARQLRARGLEPAGENRSWFQPVALVERTMRSQEVSWTIGDRMLPFDPRNIALVGREADARLADARVVFVGHGARIRDRGIDQLAGADLEGAVAIMLIDAPDDPGFPSFAERSRAVREAGVAALITLSGPREWRFVTANGRLPSPRPASRPSAPITGTMPLDAARALFAAAGADPGRLLDQAPGPSFHATTLPFRAGLHVATDVRAYASSNVIGRIRGSGSTGESVMLLAHWDHFGFCRPEGAPDRICNGAVDNASGVAMMIEVAGRLARGPRPVRDIVVMATAAEEPGMLGSAHFAEHPIVPAASIVAALNLDTMAVQPAGQPVAIIGRGTPALDAAIAATALALGRRMYEGTDADAFAARQDGWALRQAGIPAVMVGSFDSARLNAYLQSRYHQPSDQADGAIEMGGAVEDANLLVALGRRLADPAQYPTPPRPGR